MRLRIPAAGGEGSPVAVDQQHETPAEAGGGANTAGDSLVGGGGGDGDNGASQRRQASDVEALVLSKIRSREAIILCVEECNNWQLAPARSVVARVDHALRRTVIVSSKLDTKFAQFGRPELSFPTHCCWPPAFADA